jgi:hypothetical protein
MKFEKVKVFAGRQSHLKAGDIMQTITRIPGVTKGDLGKIEMYHDYTTVEINRNIVEPVMTSLRKMKLKGKSYRVQKIAVKWKR